MEKKKRKINVVDVCIILVIALLLAAFAFFAVPGKNADGVITEKADSLTDTTIRYTVAIEGFAEEFKDLVKVGEEVRNVDFDCEVGKVVAVTPAEHTTVYNYSKVEEKMVPAEVPDSFKQTITVEVAGVESDKSYYVGAIQLRVGKSYAFKTPSLVFKGTVMNIEGGKAR
ncbi:MAG: DUF4330 family protein [Clostridia bacterium]|nr:DUF4330 family protein [Clostridia bacterium]